MNHDLLIFKKVLWEIWTLGIIPYPGLNDDEIYDRVNQLYRLNKPTNCPDDIYFMMKSCWKELNKARPRFKQLEEKLKSIYQVELSAKMNDH